MEKNRGLHILYKNLGETPNECILRFRKEKPELDNVSMTYAGRLDPMAEGVLLVLSGDKVYEKDKYLDLPKTYEFEILWGIETDTLDVLGKISNFKFQILKPEDIKEFLEKSVGKFEQKYPAFSSKPVNGKPLFEWARGGKLEEIEIPVHEVEVLSVKYVSRRVLSNKDLLSEITNKISKVNGDFRQKEILERWLEILENSNHEEFTLDKIEIKVSSGFYVRQFVYDVAEKLGLKALTFHIKRTMVGDFFKVEN